MKRLRRRVCLAVLLAVVGAHAFAAAPTDQEIGTARQPEALVARFSVEIVPSAAPSQVRRQDWVFVRSAERIELRKGAIDETWSRDARGRIAFERTFHEHAKVVDYSSGELATLGVQADWKTLAGFVDAREMAALRLRGRSRSGPEQRLRYEGRIGDEQVRIDWLPALQLPALVQRDSRSRGRTRIELKSHQTALPPPDARSSGYLHLDAADFGDMDYEPVVRLSEALDIRSGWRRPHSHD